MSEASSRFYHRRTGGSSPYDERVPSPLQVTLRPYDHPDSVQLTGEVQDYYRTLYGGPDSTPMAAAEFAPPQGQFLVGYLGDVPAAMGGWRFITAAGLEHASRPAEVKRMFVRPDVRGRGFGLTILRALEHGAAAAGADWMVLETGSPQTDALALYRRAGYGEVASFGHFACAPRANHLGRALAEG